MPADTASEATTAASNSRKITNRFNLTSIFSSLSLKDKQVPIIQKNQELNLKIYLIVTIEYNKIDPKLSGEFEHCVHELGRILKSEGMAYWELFQDPSDIGHYIEVRIADTWTDHIRQHEYVTKNVPNTIS
jgi:Transmembrane secretion effector